MQDGAGPCQFVGNPMGKMCIRDRVWDGNPIGAVTNATTYLFDGTHTGTASLTGVEMCIRDRSMIACQLSASHDPLESLGGNFPNGPDNVFGKGAHAFPRCV